MGLVVEVNDRVMRRHPELGESDVRRAWNNAFVVQLRPEGIPGDWVLLALGSDGNGRLLEMIASQKEDGTIHVFHALTPPTIKFLIELGLR